MHTKRHSYFNTNNNILILLSRATYKSIVDLSRKELRIAGLRVDPKRFIGSRRTYYNKIQIVDLEKGETPISIYGLPENPNLTNFVWSPDEKKIAMTNTTSSGVELWILNVTTRIAKKLISTPINASLGSSINWLKNGKEIFVKFIPKNRQEIINQTEIIPSGPKVTENNGVVDIDMYIIVSYGVKISEVANNVQSTVKYTLEKSLNVSVNSINIYVQGVRVNNTGKKA